MIVNLFFFNRCFDKSRLKILISWSLKNYGEKNTIELVESLKQLGFEYATQAGISLSLDDLKIPPTKSSLVSEAEIKIQSTQLEYQKGHLTAVEKFQQLIDTWHRTSETLKQNVVQHFRSTNILNPVYMMAFSGARGNLSQVRQLVGMRGLMADPQGQIIDFPIRSNFREGLTLTEYVISCYGARKGLVDTALRTANSGYLTRRLVDVSQHVIVCQLDCGTRHGIFLSDMKQGQKTILSLENRLIGRVLAENINFFTDHKREIESQDSPMFSSEDPNRVVLPANDFTIDIIQESKLSGNLHVADKRSQNEFQPYFSGQKLQTKKSKNKYYFSKKSVLIARNQEISASLAAKIVKLKKKVLVRSPLTCEAKNSICQLCYGWSLAHGNLVSLGEAVGILAAQSIGEPGTQLTMRTFHTGGVFSGDVMEEIRAPFTGIIKYSEALQGLLIRTPHGKVAFLTKTQGELILTSFYPIGSPLGRELGSSQKVDHKGLPSKNVELDSSQFSSPTNSQMLGDKVKKFQIPSSTILFVRESEVVLENQLIAEFSSMSTQSNQRIQAKHNLNSELEGQIFFDDVLLGVKIGKEGDITRTARKLGSIWVLSGKLYQSMLPSVFFPKAGDLIDTKSIMNQTLILIPYNGFLNSNRVLPSEIVAQDETNLLAANIQNKSFAISDDNNIFESPKKYVSSNSYKTKLFSYDSNRVLAQEDSSSMKTGRIKILNKKNIVSKKNIFYSSLLPKSKSKVTTLSDDRTECDDFSGNYLKIRNFSSKLAKDIILSNSIGSLNLKSIRYKKYGYFLDLYPNPVFGEPRTIFSKLSKNCENEQNFSASKPVFTKTSFFLCNSIEQEFKDISQIKQFFYLQWFPQNYKTKSGGFLFLENNYLNENSTEGQFFWVQEENYKFNKQKLFFPKKSQLKDFASIESNKVFAPEENGNMSLLPSQMVELNKVLPSEMLAQEKMEGLGNKNSDISKLSQVKKLDSNYIFSRKNYAIKKQLYNKRSKLLFSEYLAKKTNFPNGVPFIMDEPSRIKNSRFIDFKRILAQKDSRIVTNENSKRALLPEKNEQAEKFFLLDSPSEIKIQTKWIKKDSPIISKSNFQGNPLVFFSNFSGLAVIHKPKNNLSQKNINTAFFKLFKNKVQTKSDFSISNDKMRIQQDLKIRECSTIYDGTIRTQKKLSTIPYGTIDSNRVLAQEGNGRPSGSQDNDQSKILSEKKIKKFFWQNPGTIFGKNTYLTKSQKQKLFLGNFRVLLTPQLPFSEINIFTNHSSFYLKDEPIQLSFTSQNNFVLSKKTNLNFSSLLNYKKDLFKQTDYLQKDFLSPIVSQRVAHKGLPSKMVELDLSQKGDSSSQPLTSQEYKLRSNSSINKTSNFKNTYHERKKTSSNINNFIQVTIKPGWIYFPKNQKYVTKYHQSLQRPGSHFVDDIIFDQHMIYSECISTKNYPLSYFCKLDSNKVLPSKRVAQEQKSSTIDSNKVFAQEENGQMNILSSQMEDSKVKNKNLYLKKLLNFSEIARKINESTFVEDNNLDINNGSKQIQNTFNSLLSKQFSLGNLSKGQDSNRILTHEELYSSQKNVRVGEGYSIYESTRRDDEIFTRQKKLKSLHEFLQLFFFSSQRINQKTKNLITPFKKLLDTSQTKKLLLNCDIFLMSFYFTQFLFIGKIKNFNLLKIYFIGNTKHRFCKFLTKVKTSSLGFQKVTPKNQDSNGILLLGKNSVRVIHEELYSNIDSNKVLAQAEIKLVSRFFSLDAQMRTQKSQLSLNEKIRVNTFSSTMEKGRMSIGESFSCFFRGEFKPKLFILVRKANEYTLVDSSQNKKLVDETNQLPENGVTPDFENFQLKITSLPWFNKQKITKLISTFPAVDFQVDSFLRFKTSHKNRILKQTNFLEIFVSFLIPSKYPLKSTKIKLIPQILASNSKLFSLVPTNLVYQKMATQGLQSPSSGSLPRGSSTRFTKQKTKKGSLLYFNAFNNLLNFSVFRKIELSSFLISEVKNNNNTLKSTQLLLYSNNWTFKTNPLSLTCFFSPYEGEITNIKTDSFGKQSCLFLTNNDQLSFSTPLPNLRCTLFKQKDSLSSWTRTLDESSKLEIPCVQVGQLMRYGEEFMQNVAITASGQIIQVENSKVVLRKAQPILFSSRGVFHVYHKDFVEKNSPLLTLFYQRLKTGDIVQGIPQIEQFFEARQTKEGEILPENLHTKLREFFEISKQHFSPQEAARRSLEKIQQILVDGVQKVYQSQGVTIADKHLEVIIRQMTSKVKILEGGQTGLLRGELIDLDWIEVVNKGINSQKAEYEPVILGITKAALETESFISAASFQETTRILARAAIERKTDFLRGLKENVILGHLIPAGTGFSLSFDPEISKYSDKNKNKNENFFTNVFLNLDIQNTN